MAGWPNFTNMFLASLVVRERKVLMSSEAVFGILAMRLRRCPSRQCARLRSSLVKVQPSAPKRKVGGISAACRSNLWRRFKNKFNNLFRKRLKETKIANAQDTNRPVYICRNHGGIRIVYTRNDIHLMDMVFEECKSNFASIAQRDLTAAESKQNLPAAKSKQRRLTEWMPHPETELHELADDRI